jgi:hypothetical protein
MMISLGPSTVRPKVASTVTAANSLRPLPSRTRHPRGTVTGAFPRSFATLKSEQAILNDYLIAKEWSFADLADQVLFANPSATVERPKWLGPALEGDAEVKMDSSLCEGCSLSCFESLLTSWWTEERKTEAAKRLLDGEFHLCSPPYRSRADST